MSTTVANFPIMGWTSDMNPQQRNLSLAIGASLLLHAVVLSIHFKLPEKLADARDRALDVILVNSKSATRPTEAQAKAQANLDGGGNTDLDRRASTPLPVSRQTRPGDEIAEKQRRITELEAQTQQMMTAQKSAKSVTASPQRFDQVPPAPPNISGLDLANSRHAILQLQGQVDRNIEDYNKRPRKKFIGARTEEYRFAQYVEDWRQKVERIGNLNYPDAARGKMFGSLVLTVIIRGDGTVERVDINRPSGHKLLDDAARRIVQMGSPYSAFPADIARDTDILEITRTWTFTNADKLQGN